MHCIIVGEWIAGSEKKDHLLYILSGRTYIKPFSIYLIHTLTIERLIACVCVEMADLFHSKPFFDANLPAIPRSSALSTRILLQPGYEVL